MRTEAEIETFKALAEGKLGRLHNTMSSEYQTPQIVDQVIGPGSGFRSDRVLFKFRDRDWQNYFGDKWELHLIDGTVLK